MRFSSAKSIRIHWARGGTSMSISRSTAPTYASSLAKNAT